MKNYKISTAQPKDGWPNSEDIVKEYFEHAIDSSGTKDLTPIWCPSPAVGCPYLPPSLLPVTPERIMDCNFSKWG